MVGKSTHLQVILQQSTQNTATLQLQTGDKNQWAFLLYNTGVDFSSHNNSANLDSLAKVSVPVQSIIPYIFLPKKLKMMTYSNLPFDNLILYIK